MFSSKHKVHLFCNPGPATSSLLLGDHPRFHNHMMQTLAQNTLHVQSGEFDRSLAIR